MILLITNLLVLRDWSRIGNGTLRVYVLDIGQGDSTLLVSPSGKQILIDGGPDLSALTELGKKLPLFDKHLELLILSHPDKDHISALPEVLRRYNVERVMLTGVEHDLGQYQDVIEEIEKQNIPVIWPERETDIAFGDGLILDIIWPDSSEFDPQMETNQSSIVLRALYKEHSILFTGDIDDEIEQRILQTGADVRSDILKVAHHGSRTSSSTGFLLAVDPELAVISVGENNSYNHPHPFITKRFQTLGIATKSTIEEGTVAIELR